jgi:digeranylgeranylglycerophospholipid reductase
VEEHEEIGHPLHCAGLVTPRTLKVADLHRDSLVQNELTGAVIRSLSGEELSIGGDRMHALAIDRPLLDARLAEEAQEAGVELLLGTAAYHFERRGKSVRVHLDGSQNDRVVKTRLLIGADGAGSRVARWARLLGPREVIKAANALVRLTNAKPDFVEVFVGQSLAPGWFGWVIPLGDDEARVGIGSTDGSPQKRLQRLMEAFPERFRGAEILHVSGGIIPLGLPDQIHADNVMLVGDAACQVKPTSGGGVYTGLLGARECARVAVRALGEDDLSSASLSHYRSSWLRQMGQEVRLGMLFRHIFTRLADDDFDRLLRLSSDSAIQRSITRHGDIDYPSRLLDHVVSLIPGLKFFSSLAGVRKPRCQFGAVHDVPEGRARECLLEACCTEHGSNR